MKAARIAKNEKSTHQVWSNMKVFHIVFFDCNGVMHHEFLIQDLMVNEEYYPEVMRRLCKVIPQKHREFWKNQSQIFYHDNLSAHTYMFVHKFSAKNKTEIITQLSNSSDLCPADIFLFPKLKTPPMKCVLLRLRR